MTDPVEKFTEQCTEDAKSQAVELSIFWKEGQTALHKIGNEEFIAKNPQIVSEFVRAMFIGSKLDSIQSELDYISLKLSCIEDNLK